MPLYADENQVQKKYIVDEWLNRGILEILYDKIFRLS